MSQQEDDLRALSKIMDLLRGLSIILVVANIYWFCHESHRKLAVRPADNEDTPQPQRRKRTVQQSVEFKMVDAPVPRPLMLRHKGREERENPMDPYLDFPVNGSGFVFLELVDAVYRLASVLHIHYGHRLHTDAYRRRVYGYRMLKNNMMDDRFNEENESFMQETKLMENEYSVNLPTRFYYKKRWNKGYINVVNPFRASIVLGTPGSGKSYAIINNFIKQQIEKGFGLYLYDYKYV